MPRKPNYRLERAERDRVKKAKKEEKIKLQQERAALRKAGDDDAPDDPAPMTPPCASRKAFDRGRHQVANIAATATAMTAVVSQPIAHSGRGMVNEPMTRGCRDIAMITDHQRHRDDAVDAPPTRTAP